jgi:outer membrane protein OmpA-like peptidoglycan-associated protein
VVLAVTVKNARICPNLEPMRSATSLSLQSPPQSDDDEPALRRPKRGRALTVVAIVLLLAFLGALGFVGYEIRQRGQRLESQIAALTTEAREASVRSRQALERAEHAEAQARAAAEGRQLAEAQTATAREEATAAHQDATTAREAAAQAQAEAERVRKQAEAEMKRLEEALGQVAETRRTALGLVMNLGSDYLKFEFDRAELRAEDRELLSRIAGILLTSQDYTVSVNGHTDDVGNEAYNQRLSERRAQAVRDYLVKAGLPAEIMSVTGHGKALPLVRASSDQARAKNRRVELGITHTRIRYGRQAR